MTTYNQGEKIWSGSKKTALFNPEASLGQVLFTCLTRQHPDNVLQINDGEQTQLTSGEVLSMSIKVAYNLRKLNLKKTDFVGILAHNTTNLMPLCYGMMFIGVPFHALDYGRSKDGVVKLWQMVRPKLIFCDGSMLDVVKEAVTELNLDCQVYTIREHRSGVKQFEDLLQDLPNGTEFYPSEITSSSQTIAISNSSGSTGLPKAMALSHRFCLELVSLQSETQTPSSTNLVLIPLFWQVGILTFLYPAITGCTNIISNKWLVGDDIVKLVDKYKITGVILMPMFIAQMLRSRSMEGCSLKSLESVVSLGAKLPNELRRRFEKHLSNNCKVHDNYGCSEVGPIMQEVVENKVIPFYNTDIKIIDENGISLGPNQDGQVCVRKSNPWPGYFGNKEAADEVYDRCGNWYKTGDMGHFDDEGHFHFVERIKDIIRLEAFNISPVQLEEIILQMPDVAQVCVFGVPHELKTNVAGALVIKKSGSDVTEKDIKEYVAEKTPSYMHLEGGAYFANSFPLTSSGKIIRKKATEIGVNLYRSRVLIE